jgi:hypothetical protein
MLTPEPRSEATIAQLVRGAITESRVLLDVEIRLAKDEVRSELAALKSGVIAFVAAALLANLALSSVLIAAVAALGLRAYHVLVATAIFLVTAAVAGLVGYRLVPKDVMARTRGRIETDVRLLKEAIAASPGSDG